MNNTGFIFATKMEANPFIKGFDLRKTEAKPFEIFNRDNIYLTVSGIGKSNAAMATAYLIWKYRALINYNIGAAGATGTDKDIGDIFHINKIVEYDRPKLLRTGLRILKPGVIDGFDTAILATQDKPVVSAGDRSEVLKYADLVDMEGAAVAHACKAWDAQCYLFKYVTDTPLSNKIDIIMNIHKTAGKMYGFFIDRVFK